ncbi:MAG: glutamate synthase subunit alpha, partial [Oscillospiraceae bacterium]|nr:glutamate synthase subunit alpha [Oscillospiraceae bacterium]
MEKKQTMYPLYNPAFEHDSCGIGAVISIRGVQTHRTVDDALKIVEKLQHRAGKDACGETGDGVGLMMQIPHRLMLRAAREIGIEDLGPARSYGVGMCFLPQDTLKRLQAKKMLEIIVERHGVEFLGWREVPVCPEVLGQAARDAMPCIMQCFVRRPEKVQEGLDFDRLLYIIRREYEQSDIGTYIASFSSRTVVYKGMFLVNQLRSFYPDLQSEE